jgi:hypothetical protein
MLVANEAIRGRFPHASNDLSRCRHALSSIFAGADRTLLYVAYDYNRREFAERPIKAVVNE